MLSQPDKQEQFGGRERRRHRVFITHNSEYHCRDGLCIAVRDLRTGRFLREHMAIGKRVSSGIRFTEVGGIASISEPGDPHVGEQICFVSQELEPEEEVLTSPLKSIERPPKDIVARYPN
ncbi:MAG TPA: hypothetical protein VNO21_09600 [Polyangiaceae bacterium]|nr:hypothetical protein [Polyangiaceae bacterium]